jgi:HAE1 family hydrophobic/amphiphilic exporter-1
VREVEKHLIIGSLLASLVVLLFMGSLRSTLIAAVAIPASIISSFTFIRLMGYSINTVTLLSLTICVGIVIDDAIVILENIYRHIETKRMDPAAAAVEATREISLAVTATTLSLVVIFVPLAFMTGLVGRFFSSYGATCAVAVLLSMVVSFVLTPMLCSKLLRKAPAGEAAAPRENVFARQSRRRADGYGKLVAWSLRHRAAVVAAALLTFLSTFVILRWVKVEFVPYHDQGEFELDITAPEGTSLQAMDEAVRAVEDEIRAIPEVEAVLTTVGDKREKRTNRAEVYVRLVDASRRGASIFEVLDGLREKLGTFPRLGIGVRVLSAMNEVGLRASDLVFYLHGPDLARLGQYADVFMKRMKQNGGLADVTSSLSEEKPQVVTVIDRDKASDRHLSAYDIALNLRFLVGGEKVSQYKEGGELFDIYVRAKREYRDDIKALAGLPIYNGQNAILNMGDVCDFKETKGIVQIERLNRQRSVTISANLSGLPLADAVAFVEKVKKDLGTGPEYQIKFFGLGKFLQEAIPAMALAFLLSFLFMYMILAAQFDSYLYPLIILLTLPLTLPFALLSLIIFGTTLNLFSAFGLFLLFGIVKKNAILQVDYTNTLIRQGVARDEAIVRANRDRFRPIVMTTITLVAGMIPLVFSTGVGGALRSTMAYVIIGGQSMCLLLTLLIIPVAYSLADDLRRGALRRA